MKKIFTILGVAAAMSVSAQNLVVNPSFESGIEPWVKGGTAASYALPTVVQAPGTAHEGNAYAAYNNATGTTGFAQDINIQGGAQYSISFWYKAVGDGTDARIWSVFKDASGGILYLAGDGGTTSTGAPLDPLRGPHNEYLAPSTVWKQHTLTFTSPAAATVFQFAVRAYNNSTQVHYDDFAMVQGTFATIDLSKTKLSLVKNTIVNDVIVFAKNSDIQILNAAGQVVKTAKATEGSSLNVANLAKGAYIVTGTVNGEKVAQKVIKQ